MDLREIGWGSVDWIHLLRIVTDGELLWIRWWTFGCWRHGISYNLHISSIRHLWSFQLIRQCNTVETASLYKPKN
jgi:hypothetical protein